MGSSEKTILGINMISGFIRNSFLYNLFRQSKWGFTTVVFFIIVYAALWFKKMDMVLFAYNGMFSNPQLANDTAVYYGIKIDKEIIPITTNFYWKKDFLEDAPTKYATYLLNGNADYLKYYVDQNIDNPNFKSYLISHCTPNDIPFSTWVEWHLNFSHTSYQKGSVASLWRYQAYAHDEKMTIKDSLLIIKCTLP